MLIAVVGAGTMGADIAQSLALGGDNIILLDINDAILRRALARISRRLDQGARLDKVNPVKARHAKRVFRLTTRLEDCAPADVVIEAIPDDLAQKQTLLQKLEVLIRPDTILATTTNTLSITRLAAGARNPDRMIGLHFFNPAYVMRLVEVIRSPHTRQDIIDRAVTLVQHCDKTPVLVEDRPGWVVNRIALAYLGEALSLVDDNVDFQSIDQLMEAAGFPMGPFHLMDFVGVDTAFDVSRTIYDATFQASPYRPHPRQQQLIDAGHLGRGTGRGFYPSS